jgi:hypothetical protein
MAEPQPLVVAASNDRGNWMRFGLLGPMVVTDGEGRRLAVGAPKQRALLAILLLHAN